MKKGTTTPRRVIRELLMDPDIYRVTKARVMKRRGRNVKRWVGLAKPRSKPAPALDVVTEGMLYTLAQDERVLQQEREKAKRNRAALLRWLAEGKG